MANESSFTGEVIFFHKRLSNTPENIRKFEKILDVFLELTNTYYGGFQEVTTDDMEFNEQSDYVESISYYFFSCGRWTYESSFNYINKLCKEGFDRELNKIKENFPECYNDISFYDLVGLGFQVTGKDYEPGCEVLYDFDAESQIVGIKDTNETEYIKNNSSTDGIINLEDIDFLMIEDKDTKKLVLNYDNTDWYVIFQNIEKNIKKYINKKDLDING